MKAFQKPMAFDPSLATRNVSSTVTPQSNNHLQSLRSDLGFEPAENEQEERCRELQDQLEDTRHQVAELKSQLQDAESKDTRNNQKLQSLQQVNRSQSVLMRAELQKSRRRLAHTQAVAKILGERAEYLQGMAPGVRLPPELQSLPTEEQAADEAADLVQAHQRWEKDVAQLQAELVGGAPAAGASAAAAAELEATRKRIAELEAELAQQKQAVRAAQAQAAQAPAPAAAAGGAVAAPTPAAPAQTGEDSSALREQLEAAQKESKENMKKLKQLATAYKQLDQKKGELEGQLKQAHADRDAEASKPKEPQRPALSPELIQRVGSMLAVQRQQLASLKASVAQELSHALPAQMDEVLKEQAKSLQKMVEEGGKEWKDKYTVECERRRKLHNLVQELKGNIRVYVRVRPLNERETGCCVAYPGPDEITVRNEATATSKTYQFNEVFNERSTQEGVFNAIRDLVVSMLDGFNVCIFAYGQTGAGKTHSMQGTAADPGIYFRTFNELFQVASERTGWKVELKGAILEVYNDDLRDLLWTPKEPNEKKPKLQIRQGKEGNFVPGLTQQPVTCPADVEGLLELGQANRSVACTDMNAHSSRSHLLVQIVGSMTTPEGKNLSSVITLVDLAGSERLAKSGVTGDRAKEAIAINKSLSALGDVINSRATKNSHTPFRNSTLTHVLQDSLSGDAKTLMLLQMNPCSEHVEETLCSLQFGARVNNVEMKK